MKKIILLLLLLLFLLSPTVSYAIEDPLAVPNNKFGVHILFPNELKDARTLVNSENGDWGYITIPIQATDKDITKWQKFMDDAKELHLIPIIRLSTEGDYFNTNVWRKPTEADILDFANFLNSLSWPVKNRYITVFNEVNRANEWGGQVSPSEYAKLLSYSYSVFKSKSPDFFIISAGLDNASVNTSIAMAGESYLRAMDLAIPGIFNQIDGIGSHSYPNPAFSQPPTKQDSMSVATYKYEQQLIHGYTGKTFPVFITETGWTKDAVPDERMAQYYKEAFTGIWADNTIVAVTPFLLKAGAGPFTGFSFLKVDGSQSLAYKSIQTIEKTKGQPILAPKVLGEAIKRLTHIKTKAFASEKESTVKTTFTVSTPVKTLFKWLLRV